jgi:hypothetical protein
MKYIRRPDLTIPIRARIALEAIDNKGCYGNITELSKLYKVSRTFIYSLLYVVSAALFEESNFMNSSKNSRFTKQLVDKHILIYRVQNNSSIKVYRIRSNMTSIIHLQWAISVKGLVLTDRSCPLH